MVFTDRLKNEIAQNFRHITQIKSTHEEQEALKSRQTENVKLLTTCETINNSPCSISVRAKAIFRDNGVIRLGINLLKALSQIKKKITESQM